MSSTTDSVSAAKYTVSQYLNKFYIQNTTAKVSSNRTGFTTSNLIKADSLALNKAVLSLTGFDYSDSSSGKDILNAIQAFGTTYNNVLDSTGSTGYHDVTQLRKGLMKLSNSEKADLSDIGITVKSNGRISIDKTTLASASLTKVKKVFSSDSSFMKELKNYAKKLVKESTYSGSMIDTLL